MPDAPLVSIIIRTKNEERWIGHCLRNVFQQDYPNFEVILVDNKSTDRTLQKACEFDITLVEIEQFLPGKAINMGIEKSRGDYLVCLSGHCIPTNSQWLSNLVRDLEDTNVAGVYGRQEPMSFSTPQDKRDLLIVFGLDRKVQVRDPFFHNANSAIRRELWEQMPFDNEVTNIEDRVWAKEILTQGYQIVYEPSASVYHYHGIHHDMDEERAHKVARVLEQVHSLTGTSAKQKIEDFRVIAIIPSKGPIQWCGNEPQLKFTIDAARMSTYIDDVYVATDDPDVAALAQKLGAKAPFLRPPELSEDFIDVREVHKFALNEIENTGHVPDLVATMEETYPLRPVELLNEMIFKLVDEGLDTVIAAQRDYRAVWFKENGKVEYVGDDYMPRSLKKTVPFIDLHALGCVTHPQHIREGIMLGDNLGIYEVDDPLVGVPIRDERSRKIASLLLNNEDVAAK